MLTLLYPGMLLGAATAVIPWAIHLLLRPRPRRVIFPALRFAHPALTAGRRASRLRELALLALRTVALGTAVLALAGANCRSSASGARGTATEVLVLDDSLSTAYQLGERSAFDQLRRSASARLRAPLPEGSSRTLVLASDDAASDVDDPLGRLSRATPRGTRPLGEALRRAAAALERGAGLRRLTILTDLAAHALRDVDPSWAPAALRGALEAEVLVARDPAPANTLAMLQLDDDTVLRADAPLEFSVALQSASVPSGVSLALRSDDRALGRAGPQVLTALRESWMLRCEPLPTGLHALELSVEPTDRLAPDDRRYAAVEVGPPPRAFLIAPAESASLAVRILENLLAPTGAATDQLRWQYQLIARVSEISHDVHPDLIVLTEPSTLADDDVASLRTHVALGAQLLVVSAASESDATSDANTAWSALAREFFVGDPELHHQELPCSWSRTSRFPKHGAGFDELPRCRIRRAWRVTPVAKARVEALLGDETPLLLSLRHGRGELWLLTTSPAPAWSDLGTRAAPLLSLLHALGGFSRRGAARIADFAVHGSDRRTIPGVTADGLVSVVRVAAGAGQPTWVRMTAGAPEHAWPANEPGVYAIRTAAGRPAEALYSVNWPVDESDLTGLSAGELSSRLGVVRVQVTDASTAALPTQNATPGGSTEPGLVAAVALLALLISESLLAGRGARRPPIAAP